MKWKVLLTAILVVIIGSIGAIGVAKLADYLLDCCPLGVYILAFICAIALVSLVYLWLAKEDKK